MRQTIVPTALKPFLALFPNVFLPPPVRSAGAKRGCRHAGLTQPNGFRCVRRWAGPPLANNPLS